MLPSSQPGITGSLSAVAGSDMSLRRPVAHARLNQRRTDFRYLSERRFQST